MEGIIRIIVGLPFILFIPGYILIFALFPSRKTNKGIDVVERIALSFGLSAISIVPLILFGLNYTTWGIKLESVLLSIYAFVLSVGSIAIYRWIKTDPDKRFIIPRSENKLDRVLTIILAISIIATVTSLVYVTTNPRTGEKFTEFYLLGPSGKLEGYPGNLSAGENATVIIGVANHEYQTVDYTVEIWLINQSTYYNESENENKTIINHMWFVDKITATLEHTNVDIEKPWTSQWEYNYTFKLGRKGEFKLTFLLFTKSTEEYEVSYEYRDKGEQKISGAYRENYLWINVI
jgi:uncharacterized membrane protein